MTIRRTNLRASYVASAKFALRGTANQTCRRVSTARKWCLLKMQVRRSKVNYGMDLYLNGLISGATAKWAQTIWMQNRSLLSLKFAGARKVTSQKLKAIILIAAIDLVVKNNSQRHKSRIYSDAFLLKQDRIYKLL